MPDLVIYGVGGMARETRQYAEDANASSAGWTLLGFLDDAVSRADVDGLPVLGGLDWLAGSHDAWVCLAIGQPARRRSLALRSTGLIDGRFATVVHPSAVIGDRVEVGPGTIVAPKAVVTTDARIGRHVIVNVAATVAHDDVLEDFATLAPGVHLAGTVTVGEGADLGIGCSVKQGVSIGAWSVVGAGAVVIDDVPDNATVAGVPARVIAERPAGWHEAPA